MFSREKQIKEYWEKQAKVFKTSPLATAPDRYYRNLEINRIASFLTSSNSVLDIGCGNGYSTIRFAENHPKTNFLGVDYSPQMIRYANRLLFKKRSLGKRVNFLEGNVLNLPAFLKGRFDTVVTERCLINLLDWKQQRRALLEIKKIMRKNGRLILCENTQEGLAKLNELRDRFKLPPIKVRWHNFYLPQKKLLAFAKEHFKVEDVVNIGSLYYIISRVVYARLCAEKGQEPKYLHPLNRIASQLPSLGDYSPNYIFILRKV